jgi:hypothetical protein
LLISKPYSIINKQYNISDNTERFPNTMSIKTPRTQADRDELAAKRDKRMATTMALLNTPHRSTVSIEQAASILGIAKSTAHHANRRTGFLMDGVPVFRVGRKCLVSVAHLRAALGLVEPV